MATGTNDNEKDLRWMWGQAFQHTGIFMGSMIATMLLCTKAIPAVLGRFGLIVLTGIGVFAFVALAIFAICDAHSTRNQFSCGMLGFACFVIAAAEAIVGGLWNQIIAMTFISLGLFCCHYTSVRSVATTAIGIYILMCGFALLYVAIDEKAYGAPQAGAFALGCGLFDVIMMCFTTNIHMFRHKPSENPLMKIWYVIVKIFLILVVLIPTGYTLFLCN